MAASESLRSVPRQREALIVWGGWAGHEPERCAGIVRGMLEEEGFSVRVENTTEAFADPLFEEHDLTSVDVREMAVASPGAARAVLKLYRAYQAARASADDLVQAVRGQPCPRFFDRDVIAREHGARG